MSYYTNIYYSKNVNGKIMYWQGKVDSKTNDTTINTGQLNGNDREIVNPVNIGDTFDKEVKRLKAKVKLKAKAGYKTLESLGDDISTLDLEGHRLYEVLDTRLTVNKTDANNVLKPMLAVQWKKVKRNYPMICQPKINGHRMTATLVKDLEGMFADNKSKVKLLTKSGHEYSLPFITDNLPHKLFNGNTVFDGEAYVHGEVLSNIKRRLSISKDGVKFSKTSLDSHNILFMIFDLSVPDINQMDRIHLKNNLLENVKNMLYYEPTANIYQWYTPNTEVPIVNIMHNIIYSDEEAYKHLEAALNSGFEGIILRDLDAEYGFGSRKTNMIKLKKSISGEFKIKDVLLKNQDSVRTYITFLVHNDINDKLFEVTPEGNEEQRREFVTNASKYVGKYLSCTYYERTITGLPFHAVGRIREDFDMDVTDLQIEL